MTTSRRAARRRDSGLQPDSGPDATARDAERSAAANGLRDGDAPQPDSAARRRGDDIMRRVEAFLAANLTQPVGLTELCVAAGCSAKTLEVLFRERLGLTPIRHLRARRLVLARRALCEADRRSATVAGVAMECGFSELGRFAAAYRQAFGECPSETLRATAVPAEATMISASFTRTA